VGSGPWGVAARSRAARSHDSGPLEGESTPAPKGRWVGKAFHISRVLSGGQFRIGHADRHTPPGRSSIWAPPYGGPQAADPELRENEPFPVPKDIAPAWPCSRWGLPGRRHCCRRRWSLTPPFHPYPRVKAPRGLAEASCAVFDSRAVIFCGPIRGSPRPGITRHLALWSADFPRTPFDRLRVPAIARMTLPPPDHKRIGDAGQRCRGVSNSILTFGSYSQVGRRWSHHKGPDGRLACYPPGREI
jgi:hypothetical protein